MFSENSRILEPACYWKCARSFSIGSFAGPYDAILRGDTEADGTVTSILILDLSFVILGDDF